MIAAVVLGFVCLVAAGGGHGGGGKGGYGGGKGGKGGKGGWDKGGKGGKGGWDKGGKGGKGGKWRKRRSIDEEPVLSQPNNANSNDQKVQNMGENLDRTFENQPESVAAINATSIQNDGGNVKDGGGQAA